jgi:transcriptional regulator with XRE-family HTH domain
MEAGAMETNRVRSTRIKRGLSQTRLSALTLIAQSDISAIERGRRAPGAGWRQRLADALEVSERELFPTGARPRGGDDAR